MSKTYKAGIYGPLSAAALLAVLKLTGVITWSWWWVTAPVWAPVALSIVIVGAFYALIAKYL